MAYDIDDIFNSNIPEAVGLPALGSTPGGNTFSQGVSTAINQGETQGNMTMVDGYFQSGNFSTGVSGWKLSPNGDFEGNNVTIRGTIVIGGEYITVAVGDSIQAALDAVNAAGGGTVVLENGVHVVTSDIVMYSNTTLQGQNRSSSIIYFAGTSSSVVAQGSNVYTTGTITVANNGTTVTGSGTAWATNATAGQYIFLGGAWYPISVVNSDTSITIGLPYGGSALAGSTYIVCNPIYNAYVKDLTVSSSTDSGIKFYYVNNGGINNLEVQACLVGIDFNHTAQCQLLQMNAAANYTNYKFYDTHYTAFWSAGCIDAGIGGTGHGVEMNNVSDSKFDSLFILNSTGDGVNLTDCRDLLFNAVSSKENTGSGFELVSGNNMVVLSGTMSVNNGDSGVKLTATSDNVFIQNSLITGNTGHGVNIAASTNDSCVITGNNFASNSTSAVNDAGTGTVIRGNVGIMDNATGNIASSKFGGSGADGALSISSGTTTIDLGGAKTFIKNYSSMSITGTANVIFSNPHAQGTIVILKSFGDVTISSSHAAAISTTGMGGGSPATASSVYAFTSNNGADPGSAGTATGAGLAHLIQVSSGIDLACGAGGNDGADSFFGGTGGAGGRGGGALYIECGGALDFDSASTISAGGVDGSNGSNGNNGGGGGGGGGTIVILYKTLTDNSGTLVSTGGTGGDSGGESGGAGGAGAISGGLIANGGGGGGSGSLDCGPGGGGGGGNGGSAGAPGTNGGSGGSGGGGGGGSWFVTQNTEKA